VSVATINRQQKAHLVIKPVEADAPGKVIREPEFAKRLGQACEGHATIPPLHSGRLTWVKREMERRFATEISVETVRKWFSGEAKPRHDKLVSLAQLLEVDVGWLSLGLDPTLQPRERKLRNAMADGAVNVVAGLIQMDGGYPAFPEPADQVALDNHVDLHAIIKGAKYDLHISLGERDGVRMRFSVPSTYEAVVVLGVIKCGFAVEIFEIPAEVIAAGTRNGGSIDVDVAEVDCRLRKVESFEGRL